MDKVVINAAVARRWKLIAARGPEARYAVIFALHDRAARYWLGAAVLMAAAVATTAMQVRTDIGPDAVWVAARYTLAGCAIAAVVIAERFVAIARALHVRCTWRHGPLADDGDYELAAHPAELVAIDPDAAPATRRSIRAGEQHSARRRVKGENGRQ